MALTDSEEKRIQRIESAIADINLALNNLASSRQLSHVSGLLKRDLEEVRTKTASLQTQLDAIKQ